MSGEAHTPRPWKVLIDPNDEWPKIVAGSNTGTIVANVNPESFSFGVADLVEMPARANARLIAASPDMLTALKKALSDSPDWRTAAQEAIGKAEEKQ